jgi:hypothetical protein
MTRIPLVVVKAVGGSSPLNGIYFASAADDVHAVGTLGPLIPGYVGCIVIRPDGRRVLARPLPDPLAQRQD